MQNSLDPFLKRHEVQRALGGIATSTLYRWMDSGYFPKAIRFGPNRIGWRQSVVDQWLQSREAESQCDGGDSHL